jgi:hypothetical protein
MLFELEIFIWVWNLLFNSKSLVDLKFDIWILNYYFLIQELAFQFRKLLIEYKNKFSNFEYFYLNMKFYISTLENLHLIYNDHLIWTLKWQFWTIILGSQKIIKYL